MKQSILLLIALIASTSFCAQVTITHNNSQVVVPGVALTCMIGGVTHDTNYFGVFDLENDFGITEDWQIMAVEAGIEDADNLLNGTFPLFVAAYTTDDGTPNGNLVFLGGDTLHVTSEDELVVVCVTFPPNVIVPAGATVVIKIEAIGDGQSGFRIGATNIASNDDSWGQAPDCGFPGINTHAATGWPDVHNILNVVGDTSTGLNEALSQSVMTYPNPTTGLVNIQIPERVEVREVRLYDMLGNELEAPFANNRIDISAQANGLYFLVMQTSQGILRKSIVKQ